MERLLVDLRRAAARGGGELPRRRRRGRACALDLSCPRTPLWVRGDSVRLRQIFTNLLANAVTYTPRGRQRQRARRGGTAGR